MNELKELTKLLSTAISLGGGLWLAWGIITTGFAINDREGDRIRNGLLMCVGAAVVTAGGVLIGRL